MAKRYEEDSCSLMRVDTEHLEEEDPFRDVIMESDHYLLEFQKTKRHVIVYDCSHGWRFHSILRKNPEIKRYRIHYSRLNSSFECVSSLLLDQGLILDDICTQRIATCMVEHRIKYRPGSPVKVVARLFLRRREQVNRCVNYGHMDLAELEDGIGLEYFTISVGWHFDLLDHEPETTEEEMCDSSNFTPLEEIGVWLWGEYEEYDAAVVPFVAGSNCLPCMTFHGSGEEICSICLNEFSQGDEFFRAECLHNFHHKCIESWMMKKSNCPVCRRHIQIPMSNELLLQVDP